MLFFPQMRPEKKAEAATEQDFIQQGVSKELVPVLMKTGILTISQLKEANANKLFNDVCGMRKKMKLENVKNPSLDEVKAWIEK